MSEKRNEIRDDEIRVITSSDSTPKKPGMRHCIQQTMKHTITPLLTALLLTVATACNPAGKQAPPEGHEEVSSVYYWKTVFQPDSADLAFLQRHDIRRIYLRLFDVTVNPDGATHGDAVMPNATVRFDTDSDCGLPAGSALADMEFVPVVYITLDALEAMKGHEGTLASRIVTRVRNMCSYNAIPNVTELQLDCDWTRTTESSYFALCDSVRQRLSTLRPALRLSSTIRLHQLNREAPPVDNGVLMVYNTGSFDNPDASNSIIDLDDVAPYLTLLPGYPLHLDVAYPTYSWQLLFRGRRFIGLLNRLNLSDTAQFARVCENVYTAKRDTDYGDRMIYSGDMVRRESSDAKKVSEIKSLVEKYMTGRPHSNILYHLDSNNLSKYTTDEIEDILSVNR